MIRLSLLLCLATVRISHAVDAEGVTEDESKSTTLKPYDRKAETTPIDSPDAAKKGFRRATIPAGFKAGLWATEPLLANPVAFSFDGQGRMYIAETHRYRTSVLDIRHYMSMLEDDLANRNQTDWERSIKKNFPSDWQDLAKESEVVRLVEDTDSDGTADKTSVYADGFNSMLDGIASGVLARPDGVWLTNIPGLYKLTGKGADGKAEKKEEVFRGFGVRFNYTGHDLHGLIKGPDGRLYFSIGDRGTSVKTKEGTMLDVPDEGAIFRCEEDGSHLELVMRGLRNPQELAFDDYGNLFTCDNDSDQGDRERLVYVVEGGDAGWRVGYQHCPQPAERNPWLAEHMWEPRDPAKNQPAYILSPLANLPDGPGGLVHYPGTGLPEKYNGCFFLACYKGTSATSQVAVWKPVPDGASFKLEMLETFIPGCQATDVDFGPDSRMYVSFWDEGWERTAQGRIMKVEHEEARKAQAAQISEIQKLLGEGMKGRAIGELIKLLNHADQRVRLEAQWEHSSRSETGPEHPNFKQMTLMQKLHTIWSSRPKLLNLFAEQKSALDFGTPTKELTAVIASEPREVGAAALDLVSSLPPNFFSEKTLTALLPVLRQLAGSSDAVLASRSVTALGQLGAEEDAEDILRFCLRLTPQEQYSLHSVVMALFKLALRTDDGWIRISNCAEHSSPVVRMVVMQTAAHLCRSLDDLRQYSTWHYDAPETIEGFLCDAEPVICREAARLINDQPIPAAMASLADELFSGTRDTMFLLRSLNANFRCGGKVHAENLAKFAADTGQESGLRAEALVMLGLWEKGSDRDRVTGVWRPRSPNEADLARDALLPVVTQVLSGPPSVAAAALNVIDTLKGDQWESALIGLVTNEGCQAMLRVQALHVLAGLNSRFFADVLQKALSGTNSTVRIAAAGILGKTDPASAAKVLSSALATGSPEDHRSAFTALATLPTPEVDAILTEQLAHLTASKVPAIARLELLEAARKRDTLKDAVAGYEASLPKDDPLAKYALTLEGGDADAGKKIYNEHAVAACKRCHQINKSGGEAGPPLDGIASHRDRRYLLESIVNPNAQIAETFRMVVCTMKDGTVHAGVIQSDTPELLTIRQPGDEPVTLKPTDIASREAIPSGMMPGLGELLTARELRDLVEYLTTLTTEAAARNYAPLPKVN
jgi:quinoprotein glucose dehydrogenase